jgi:hypothetical protein
MLGPVTPVAIPLQVPNLKKDLVPRFIWENHSRSCSSPWSRLSFLVIRWSWSKSSASVLLSLAESCWSLKFVAVDNLSKQLILWSDFVDLRIWRIDVDIISAVEFFNENDFSCAFLRFSQSLLRGCQIVKRIRCWIKLTLESQKASI